MENSNTGTDEAALLAARGVGREHAVTHRAPDTGHEHAPALHEGTALHYFAWDQLYTHTITLHDIMTYLHFTWR